MVSAGRVVAVFVALASLVAEARAEGPSGSFAIASGAALPAGSSRLGIGMSLGLEGAWRPRFGRGWLELALGVDAAQRTGTGTQLEPLVEGGEFGWRVVSRELWIAPELRLRVPLGRARGHVLLGAGPALVLVQTLTGGEIAGEPLADATEASQVLGAVLAFGVEWPLADGAFALGARYGVARLAHDAAGLDERLDTLALRVGYRFSF